MRNYCLLNIVIATALFTSCNSRQQDSQLKARVDSLQRKTQNVYTPGLGEFMNNMQLHHAKLWLAGSNSNWPLATYEVKEIQEIIADVEKYNTDRPESNAVVTIYPIVDSVSEAIKAKDLPLFKKQYSILTNSCNDCHKASAVEFNRVVIPESSAFPNQDFLPALQKP